MKTWLLLLMALAFSATSLVVSWTGRGSKIAYAETSILLSEFHEAIEARKQFESAQKEWDKNLKTLNDSLTAGMENMKARYEKASPAERNAMRQELERRNDDLQRYGNAVKNLSVEKEQQLMEPVIRKVNSFLDVWGRGHGYDLILGTLSGGNILQADPKLNVTSRILRDLNEHYRDLPEAKPAMGAPKGATSSSIMGKKQK